MSLIQTVLNGSLAEVSKLLEEDPESFYDTNEDDQTALICLCAKRDLKDDNEKYKEFIEKFKLLLTKAREKDLNINGVDIFGNGLTACMYAMENQYNDLVDLFIVNIDLIDHKMKAGGRTHLIMAARTGFSRMVASLINENADLEATDELSRTALHWAAYSTHKDISNQEVNHKEIVENLLKNDANIKALDKFGKIPLALAEEKKLTDIVALFTAHEANLKNTEEKSPRPKMR